MRTIVETYNVAKVGAAGSVTITRYSTGQIEFNDVKGNRVRAQSSDINLCKLLAALPAV